jgi:hypothetical protein
VIPNIFDEKIMKISGTQIISEHQTIKFPHLDVIGKYIKRHILENVLNCLKAVSCSIQWQEIATSINDKSNSLESHMVRVINGFPLLKPSLRHAHYQTV